MKLAEAYGCVGLRVTKPSEVVPAIEKMLSTPAPVILDVCVDKDECVFPMVPAGGANTDMILAPPTREVAREGGEVADGVLDERQRQRAAQAHDLGAGREQVRRALARGRALLGARLQHREPVGGGDARPDRVAHDARGHAATSSSSSR